MVVGLPAASSTIKRLASEIPLPAGLNWIPIVQVLPGVIVEGAAASCARLQGEVVRPGLGDGMFGNSVQISRTAIGDRDAFAPHWWW